MRTDQYPLCTAYAGHAGSGGDCAASTADERIASIWPFLVRRVAKFVSTLKPSEKINCDAEDALTELWIELREKDHLWSPDRGQYITFAGVIADRKLYALRDKSRTVQAPRNSSCRTKEYRAEVAEERLSERRQKTLKAIERTGESIQPILGDVSNVAALTTSDADRVESNERATQAKNALRRSLGCLTANESFVMGRVSGLWGCPPQTVWQVAFENGLDVAECRRDYARAIRKVRTYLVSHGDPIVDQLQNP